MKSFLSRFGSLVLFVLSGFDRLRFRGQSRLLNHASGVHSYLWQQRILHKNFPAHAQELTDSLVRQTERAAQEQGVPFLYLNSPEIDKEARALELARQHSLNASSADASSALPLELKHFQASGVGNRPAHPS
ncbi:MAG: hypothetical protein K2X38_11905 [Gemmataceae bacterium]|nr:hypothetical protein [Gemmataceae bacterium]